MTQKNTSTPHLRGYIPEHLVISIFEYLPVKSLVKFRFVSKTFSSFIHKSSFVAAHLKRSHGNFFYPKTQQSILFHFVMLSNSTRLRLYNGTTESPFAVYDFPGVAPFIVGYCNGIICLSNGTSFYFWNPLINKTLKQEVQYSFQQILFLGLGYDYSNNYCELVCVFKDEMNQVGAKLYATSGIGDTNRWRISSVNPPPREFRPFGKPCTSVCVNKILHWLAKDHPIRSFPNSVLSFHAENHLFQTLSLPSPLLALNSKDFLDPFLMEFNGMLCVCPRVLYINEPYTIWVMKEYGNVESWVPFLNIGLRSPEVLEHKCNTSLEMLGLKNNGEELWVQNRRHFNAPPSLFNPKTLKLRHLKGIPEFHYLFTGTYMESLALIDVEDEECATNIYQ